MRRGWHGRRTDHRSRWKTGKSQLRTKPQQFGASLVFCFVRGSFRHCLFSQTKNTSTTMSTDNTNSNDPSSLLSQTVTLINIQARPELNGQIGTVESYLPDRNRYLIHLAPPLSHPLAPPSANSRPVTMALKAENLKVATRLEKVKAQVKSGMDLMRTLYKDERVWEEVKRMKTSLEQSLPASWLAKGVTLTHVGIAILLLILAMMYTFGISKCILFTSIISLLIMTALPDLMTLQNSPNPSLGFQTLVRNFPMRWRMTLHQNTGYALSPKVANGILILLLLVSGKLLMTPLKSTSATKASTANAYSYLEDDEGSVMSSSTSATGQLTLQDIYQLGYNDGKDAKDFQASLPDDIDEYKLTSIHARSRPMRTTSSTSSSYEPDLDYYPPPPPPATKSKFGIGTLLSVMGLLRTVKELGFVGGRFEPQVLMANVQGLPPMRLALLGLCVYRVVSVFL